MGFSDCFIDGCCFFISFQFKTSTVQSQDIYVAQLEEKVVHLELHLKKSLEIMQDLAKKMHVQQEVLDRTVANIDALEKQNVELVNVLEIVVKGSNKNF